MELDGVGGIGAAQAVRALSRKRFLRARFNVTVGRRWFWGGVTYRELIERGAKSNSELPVTQADDEAAIIFTSGSTGPPKGVLYTHRMFETQAAEIQREYAIQPGEVDLACFALFGLFNSAMGVTTVFPEMDFSRPAAADPRKLLAAANRWGVTQAFASPTVWDKLSRHCEGTGERIPTLRAVFSCGAPVEAAVIARTLACVAKDAHMHTPYGATEALPVATIEAKEILRETAAMTSKGAGVCVGRKFDSIEWRVIGISDEPITTIEDAEELAPGQIGELIVRGPQVSPGYVEARGARREAREGNSDKRTLKLEPRNFPWHRMGDVGYLDLRGRFWYCGRKAHRVESRASSCFSVPLEEVFNAHPRVKRSAVVGCGPAGDAVPVLIVELVEGDPGRDASRADEKLVAGLRELRDAHAKQSETLRLVDLDRVLVHPRFPVDVRHNAKINREELAVWAESELKRVGREVSPRSMTGG
jgi:acyl-CoA synthetase (AMP-forming)/AMP-acid ligase II